RLTGLCKVVCIIAASVSGFSIAFAIDSPTTSPRRSSPSPLFMEFVTARHFCNGNVSDLGVATAACRVVLPGSGFRSGSAGVPADPLPCPYPPGAEPALGQGTGKLPIGVQVLPLSGDPEVVTAQSPSGSMKSIGLLRFQTYAWPDSGSMSSPL